MHEYETHINFGLVYILQKRSCMLQPLAKEYNEA